MKSATDGDGSAMDTTYARYLMLVVLTAAVAAMLAALLFAVIRGRRKRKHNAGKAGKISEDKKPDSIVDSGNVSVFFDKQRNAVLIPYVPDLFGSGKATADIIWLDMPYGYDELGRTVKIAMMSCRNGKPAASATLMKLLRAGNWKEFTKGRLSISVYCKDRRNIMLNSTVRTSEGAYIYITKNPEICLPTDADNAELGGAILDLLRKCR
jgi:hypothetical protein